MRFAHAKELCGLPSDFEIRSQETYEVALAYWKEKTVAARREGNDALAAELSCAKELFRKRHATRVNRLCACGRGKSAHAVRCRICSTTARYYGNKVMESTETNVELNAIETALVPVPERSTRAGKMRLMCRQLATKGQVGDSFVTDKPPPTVNTVARNLGMKIIYRLANPQEKDRKKRLYRVWRSDGKSMEELNDIIRRRLAGEEMPPSESCIPMTPEEIAKSKGRRGRAAGAAALLILFWLFGGAAQAGPTVTLGWNAPATADVVTNYNIYYGVASAVYTNAVPVGNVTNATISLPAYGMRYFFAATDVDTNGLESVYSVEIFWDALFPGTLPWRENFFGTNAVAGGAPGALSGGGGPL